MSVEPGPKFEDVRILLEEPQHGLDAVSGVLGIPEWWPTGSRVSVVLAHSGSADRDEPLIRELQTALTERKVLTLRFNFPYAEAGRKKPDPLPVLQRALRSAVAILGRDPTAAPAYLFLAGKDLGAAVAAHTAATSRLRVEGLALLGLPLHTQDKPEEVRADDLFRIVCPVLFVQGSKDRQCDLDTLRRTMMRVGAPTTLHVVEEADHHFKVAKKSGRTDEDVREEILATLDGWIGKVLGS